VRTRVSNKKGRQVDVWFSLGVEILKNTKQFIKKTLRLLAAKLFFANQA
jgi:hypothetical protein